MKYLFTAVVILFTSSLFAQDIIDKMARLTCECMEDKDVQNKSSQEVTDIMTNCLTQHLVDNIVQFQKELDVDITDQTAMQAIGEKIGYKMASVCPNTIMVLAGTSDVPEPEVVDGNTFTGKITRVKNGDVLTLLQIKSTSGEVESFLWLASFEGDEDLLELGESIIGASVTVNFEELDVFDAGEGAYIPRKILTSSTINR